MVMRGVSLVLLALIFWLSLDRGRPESTVSAGSANLVTSVRDWSRLGIKPDNIVAQLNTTPSTLERDWLADLRAAGSHVTWTGNLPAAAIGAQPVASPDGGIRVFAAAPDGSAIRISDDVGVLDTAIARNGGAGFAIASASGKLAASIDGASATTAIPDIVHVKRLLVIGGAGWESKFVVAALEEAGWKVDANVRVAPGVDVTQGSLAVIDTARYSAVVALDNVAASRASELVRFVANGGGLILAGAAAANDAFASLRPGVTGKVENIAAGAEPGEITLAALSYVPIAGLRADAIVLERRGANILVAARRFGSGRVIQSGYLDTWRWRMSGSDASPQEHRAWWTDAVANVAYASRPSVSSTKMDNAPVANLIGALGPASSPQHADLSPASGPIPLWLLFALLSLTLLAEWSSRRLRGVR
jgi:hypothetical protein